MFYAILITALIVAAIAAVFGIVAVFSVRKPLEETTILDEPQDV